MAKKRQISIARKVRAAKHLYVKGSPYGHRVEQSAKSYIRKPKHRHSDGIK